MGKLRVLLKNALGIVTMDATRRELSGAAVLVEGRRIAAVGPADTMPAADEVVDLTGHVLTPGLVNTHHHMYQTLTRAVPSAQDATLFGWLQALYPVWARLTPGMIDISTRTAMAELMLSGCSTSSDHLYIFPNGTRLDDQIAAAHDMGMRFHACRGAMSLGQSQGGLPPDAVVEQESAILADMQRVAETYHDPAPGAMLRIALAPCSPFSVTTDLMRETAVLARTLGVGLHTHLAENDSDVAFSRDRFGMTPAEYADSLGWTGPDVWHAHCVKLDAAGIGRFGSTHTGVAHCPCSNMRLGSGIAPLAAMRAAGVAVGLGVDGSASNDGADMLGEARQAMLLQRVLGGAGAMTARQALELATVGGAQVLGRDDIGRIEPGMMADLAAWDMRGIDHAGALHDPVAALVFCAPRRVAHLWIDGRQVVSDGTLLVADTRTLAERHNSLARQLVDG